MSKKDKERVPYALACLGLKFENQTIKQKSVQQENLVAEICGGRVQPGSGSSIYAKGDVKTQDYLIECKRTDKRSIGLKVDWLEKITEEARTAGKRPMMSLEFEDTRYEQQWFLIPRSEWERIREKLEGDK